MSRFLLEPALVPEPSRNVAAAWSWPSKKASFVGARRTCNLVQIYHDAIRTGEEQYR